MSDDRRTAADYSLLAYVNAVSSMRAITKESALILCFSRSRPNFVITETLPSNWGRSGRFLMGHVSDSEACRPSHHTQAPRLPDTMYAGSQYRSGLVSAQFTVGHRALPPASTGGGGPARRRRRDQRWAQLTTDSDGERELDSSFFFKSPDTCAHSLCPVYGKVGVFEVGLETTQGTGSRSFCRLFRIFQCVNTQSDLESCGDCAPHGVNCAEIAGAASVSCIDGQCLGE